MKSLSKTKNCLICTFLLRKDDLSLSSSSLDPDALESIDPTEHLFSTSILPFNRAKMQVRSIKSHKELSLYCLESSRRVTFIGCGWTNSNYCNLLNQWLTTHYHMNFSGCNASDGLKKLLKKTTGEVDFRFGKTTKIMDVNLTTRDQLCLTINFKISTKCA